ncbi:restriction endonuclease subunit S [Accumulibacter sp.]|uniref:restriction endonuclease subunit S n=1 Tax=Accumulibacter sp. TaxID=2053492 RepID=UPI002878BAB0|nr:restriction endonuclease subunit S [Accumulibacter sp.]MDS4054990.1 restriction endonuclease subunit S [Accumulibacter sp.]
MKYAAYPKYRPSGVEWIGDVPEHWCVKHLRHTLSRNDGGVWGDEGEPDGTIVLRSTEQTLDGGWKIEDPARRLLTESDRRQCVLDAGDLVVTKSSGSALHIGKTSLVDERVAALGACFSNFMQRLRMRRAIDPRIAFYVLNSPTGRQQLVFNSNTTTGLANLTGSVIGNVFVAYPPDIGEQKAIADFLDRETAKIDTLVAKKRTLIERLKEKRTALISRTVTRGLPPDAARAARLDPHPKLKPSGIYWLGDVPEHWEVTRLKYTASRIVDCPHETPIYADDGEYLVIRTADLSSGRMDLSSSYRVDADEFRRRVRREPLLRDDIVYGREGERWGFAALVPESPSMCLGQRMMQFRAAAHFDCAYLMWQLNSAGVFKQGAVDVAGATAPHVNVETIRNYWLAEPPLPEQRAIADFLNRETVLLDAMVAKIESAIERLQEYRTALITSAVTGKIDVLRETNGD